MKFDNQPGSKLNFMKNKKNLRALLCATALLASAMAWAADEGTPPPSAPAKASAAELEKLVAPIALYSDSLVATILPAAVYPLEIVQAARFVKDTNNLAKLDEQPWDENVKAIARVPAAIQKMDAELTWTTDLGQAFLEQPQEVMDTIQALRVKAQNLGTLKTSPEQVVVVTNVVVIQTNVTQVVTVTNQIVQVYSSNPQVVYVPMYDPWYVYYPRPVYYVGPPPVVTFAVGVSVGLIIANSCDWHHGGIYVGHHGVAVWGGSYHGHSSVNVNVNRNININNNNNININNNGGSQKWQPDQNRMRTAGTPASRASVKAPEARGWSSGTDNVGAKSKTTSFSQPAASQRASSQPQSYNRPAAKPSTKQSSVGSSYSRPASSSYSRDSAFGGLDSGSSSRNFSSRGSVSRGGGGGGGGGRSFGGGRGR